MRPIPKKPERRKTMDSEMHSDVPRRYDGWLVSTSIFKRAFAVLGHSYFAILLMYIPVIIIGAFVALIGAVLG